MAAASAQQALVKFLAVGRLVRNKEGGFSENQHQVVAWIANDKNDPQLKSYKQHVKEIMNRGAAKIKPNRRIRLTSDGNDYDLHVMGDLLDGKEEHMIVFFAVTMPDFGTQVGKLLEELKTTFYKENDSGAIQQAKANGPVHKASQRMLSSLIQKYSTNKLSEVAAKVEEVKVVMQENVSKTLENVEKLDDLEAKAETVQNSARQFERGAGTLKSTMRCKYYKMTALIVLIVGAVLTVIIVPIALKAKN